MGEQAPREDGVEVEEGLHEPNERPESLLGVKGRSPPSHWPSLHPLVFVDPSMAHSV